MSAQARLFERERESAALSDVVENLRRGNGSALLLEGVAGIGKTALLAEAGAAARAEGVQVRTARAGEWETGFLFGVVRQLFEPLLAAAGAAGRAALLAGPAAPAAAVVGRPPADDGPPVGDYAALNSLLWLAVHAAEQRPLLLVIDDLHWADPPSLRYLAFLLPRLSGLDIAVLAAVREGEATDGPLLSHLIADPAFTVVRPRLLGLPGTSALLEQRFEGQLSPAFAEACHRATRGNPLLLGELARAVRERGLPTDDAHARYVEDLGPRAVARLVDSRRAKLTRPAVLVAGALAVLGDDTPLSDAAELADVDMHTALSCLDEIGFPEVVRDSEGPGGGGARRIRFTHPLIRSAVYASISTAGRARMHREAARLLEARTGEADLARIAGHLLHAVPAGDPHTVALLRRAAARAGTLGEPAEAAACLRRCLEEPPSAADRMAVLLELADVTLALDVAAAAGYLQSALPLATTSVERARIAALFGEAAAYVQPTSGALAALDRAAAELEPDTAVDTGDLRARIAATTLFTGFASRSGRVSLPERLPPLRRMAEADGPGARQLDCAIAYQDAMTGRPDAARRARRALSSGLLEPSERTLTARALGLAVLVFAEDGAAMRQLDDLVAYAQRRGSLRILATACAVRARGRILTGRLPEAEADAREGLEAARIFERSTPRTALLDPVLRNVLGDALLQQGLPEEAADVLGPDGGEHFDGPVPLFGGPRLRLALARGAPAAKVAEDALAAGRAAEALGILNPAVTEWRVHAALALRAAGRTEQAEELAAAELGLARAWGAPAPIGRALRLRAGLTPVRGRSLGLLLEAVDVLEGSSARLEYAAALADLGTALCADGRAQEARGRLRTALDLAEQCGAAPLVSEVRAALRAAGARPRRAALTGPEALTPSESRVADLAARGGTNRAIAHQLFITPKTVEVHLSRIYRKLGITARAQLAAALGRPTA
ncbi:AAA family ATPase [Streptomyces cyaneofuscatus]